MVKTPETIGDISLDEPGRSGPCLSYFPKRRVASLSRAETMRTAGELRLIVGLKEQAHYFTDQLIRPGRHTEWTGFPIAFRDVDTTYWAESVALVAQLINDLVDLAQRHPVYGFPGDPGRHRPLVGVDAPVGQQVQLRVEQLPVQLITRQATPPALTEDTQHRLGVLHFACLLVFGIRSPGPLRPASGSPGLLGGARLPRLLRGLRHPRARAP